MALNWNDENVMRALEDYREKKIANLAELQTIVHDLTGVSVSRMTLSRRVRGERMYNSVGRPPARLQSRPTNVTAAPTSWAAFASPSSAPPPASNSPPPTASSSSPTLDVADDPPASTLSSLAAPTARPKRKAAMKYRKARASPASSYTQPRASNAKRYDPFICLVLFFSYILYGITLLSSLIISMLT